MGGATGAWHLARSGSIGPMAGTVEEHLELTWAAYREARLVEGLQLARQGTEEYSERGGVWFALGCMLERADDLVAADKAFAKASRCVEDPVGTPYRIGWKAFQQVVATAIESLPAKLKESIGDVTLVLADYADPELLAEFTEAELLGLFTGPVRGELDQTPEMSPMIHVFRRAHEHSCSSAKEFRQEVKQTLYHEFGHYLGFGEEDLDAMCAAS